MNDEDDNEDIDHAWMRLRADELRQRVGYVFMCILMMLIVFICLTSFNVIL